MVSSLLPATFSCILVFPFFFLNLDFFWRLQRVEKSVNNLPKKEGEETIEKQFGATLSCFLK